MRVGFLFISLMLTFSTARAETVVAETWACLDQVAFWAVLKTDDEVGTPILMDLIQKGECRWLAESQSVTVKQIDEKTGSTCIVPTGETLCYWTASYNIVP